MPRPLRTRIVAQAPKSNYFKPAGIPLRLLEETVLSLDEIEALRLADAEGLYQEEAAKRMNVSRPTVARILASARRKIAVALTEGRAIRLAGGAVDFCAHPKTNASNAGDPS